MYLIKILLIEYISVINDFQLVLLVVRMLVILQIYCQVSCYELKHEVLHLLPNRWFDVHFCFYLACASILFPIWYHEHAKLLIYQIYHRNTSEHNLTFCIHLINNWYRDYILQRLDYLLVEAALLLDLQRFCRQTIYRERLYKDQSKDYPLYTYQKGAYLHGFIINKVVH